MKATQIKMKIAFSVCFDLNLVNITFTVSKHPSETFGQFIKKLRLQKGLEQRELARKLTVRGNTVYEKVSRESLSSLRLP